LALQNYNIKIPVSLTLVNTSHPQPQASAELLDFLQKRLSLSDQAIKLGLRQAKQEQAPLPIVLWSFGLLSLSQYQSVLDWQRDNNQL